MRDGYYSISTFRLVTAIGGTMSTRYTGPASLPFPIIKCKPLFVNPCITLMNIFSYSTLFKLAMHHVVGMRILIETRQWRAKAMSRVSQFVSNCRNQPARRNLAVLEERICPQ